MHDTVTEHYACFAGITYDFFLSSEGKWTDVFGLQCSIDFLHPVYPAVATSHGMPILGSHGPCLVCISLHVVCLYVILVGTANLTNHFNRVTSNMLLLHFSELKLCSYVYEDYGTIIPTSVIFGFTILDYSLNMKPMKYLIEQEFL
jgi:hypothetical protein